MEHNTAVEESKYRKILRSRKTRYAVLALGIAAIITYFILRALAAAPFPLVDPYLQPSGTANTTQKRVVQVWSSAPAHPTAKYYQLNDRSFRADFEGGVQRNIPYGGNDGTEDYPAEFLLENLKFSMLPYQPGNYKDGKGTDIYPASIDANSIKVKQGEYKPSFDVYNFADNTFPVADDKSLIVTITTNGIKSTSNEPFTDNNAKITVPPYSVKRNVAYDIDMLVYWTANAVATKTLNASTTKSSLAVGETSNSTATITTTGHQDSGGPVDVNNNTTTTTWRSDKSTVATVNTYTGQIKGVAAGTATITVRWQKEDEYGLKWDIERSFTVTVGGTPPIEEPPPGGGGPTGGITANLTVTPSSVDYRDPFQVIPDIKVTDGCVYQSHKIRLSGVNGTRTDDYTINNRTVNYTYPSFYPPQIAPGTVNVSIQATGTCGTTEWVTKPLIVNNFDNNPPEFQLAWAYAMDPSNRPITQAIKGERLKLIYIDDPEVPTPYDPDGDNIYWNMLDWDRASNEWLQSLRTTYGDTLDDLRNVLMTQEGTHTMWGSMRDEFGSVTWRSATVTIVDPNPVPVITLPNRIVEGRPYSPAISGANSYSPVNRTITQFRWTGVQNIYPSAGKYPITLEVADSTGLWSKYPATAELTVLPDLPPVVQLDNPGIGVRGAAINFKDSSYSPDGDIIVDRSIKLVCDANNNGSFGDDTRSAISVGGTGEFSITPTRVGNCALEVFVKEDWGKTAEKQFTFNVVNLAPEADFSALSVNPEPPVITTVVPTVSELMGANWQASSLTREAVNKDYTIQGATLETRGMRNLLPYKSITANNVVVTEESFERSRCGTCGNTGTTSGYYYYFSLDYRMDKRTWTAPGYLWYYNEDRGIHSTVRKPIVASINNYDNNYKYGSLVAINPNTGLVWTRVGPYDVVNFSHTYTDYLYRLSDLNNYPGTVSWDGGYYGVNPYQTQNQYVNTPSYAKPNTVPVPPPPTGFTYPTPVLNGVTMEVQRTDTTLSITSNYNKDFIGNTFKNSCGYDWYYGSVNCKLVKYNTAGQAVWQSAPTNDRNFTTVEQVASNNSRIVAKSGTDYYILNSSDGSRIFTMVDGTGADFASNAPRLTTSGYYYLGVYDDIVAYIYQTAESGFMNTVGRRATWDLKFFNLATGATTNAGTIKNFIGLTRVSYYDIDRYSINAVPKAIVSADGKLILANYYSNVLVYDMRTFGQVADIPTGADPETRISYGDNDGSYYNSGYDYRLKGLALTEDGRLKVVQRRYYYDTGRGNSSDYSNDDSAYWEKAITIQTTPSSDPSYSYGYISSRDKVMVNGDVSVKVMFKKNVFSDNNTAGIGFRSTDNKNMYRAELSTNGKVLLKKIENGTTTVLGSYDYPVRVETSYDLKVKARGGQLVVYINGVPVIDRTDGTFTSGSFGPFAELPYTVLSGFNAALYESSGQSVENQAIVNTPITYNSTYSDPEGDPRIPDKTTWVFTNIQPYKFLDAGDGASDPVSYNSYNGVTVRQPGPSLSKVGIYKVDFSEVDDPAPAGYKYPSTAYAGYQKQSYPATHNITVHRRPIAQFTLSTNADNSIAWNDTSYDPDRWLSPSNYSTEPTGINYASTRGIMNRRYNYTTPSGNTVNGKFTHPSETGVYTVRMAVADEYGAWSDWAEQTINVTVVPANFPPVAAMTYPSGTQTAPTMESIRRPTLRWTQTDAAGTVFTAFQLQVTNEANNFTVLDSGELAQNTTSTTGAWTPSMDLPTGQKLRVRVRVRDGALWSEWSEQTWLFINTAPAATLTYPSGTQSNPTVSATRRPIIQWTQTDPDPGTIFEYFEVEISNEANNLMLADSGPIYQNTSSTSGSWTVDVDLPLGVKLRNRVRVFDGFAWSAWSETRWMIVNRPPVADFITAPAVIYEGDTVTLTNASNDPDGDPLTYNWTITGPGGYASTHTTKDVNIPGSATLSRPGIYTITLVVTDPHGASATKTNTVTVGLLEITGQVRHTDKWEEKRQNWNASNPTSVRSIDTFWAGEEFVLLATVTNTGASTTKPTGVTSRLTEETLTVSMSSNNNVNWTGTMWEDDFDTMADGTVNFVFTVTWSNGVTKQTTVPVRIRGSVWDVTKTHRTH